MSEYYAVQRSDDSLSHYGVRGMKWGVRKAVRSGNAKKLSKQYNKAAKKLAKLNAKADVKTQTAKAVKYNKIAKRAAKVGAFGAATGAAGAGAYRLSKLLGAHYTTKAARLLNESVNASTARAAVKLDNAADHYGELARKHWDTSDKLYRAQYDGKGHALAGITAGALGVAAGSKIKAVAAKRRTTAKGHAKAVAKRDAWRKEMQSAFKGTQYANMPKVKTRSQEKAEKYKTLAEKSRKSAQQMRYHASQTPRPGQARYNLTRMANKDEKRAAHYEAKYNKIRRKSK